MATKTFTFPASQKYLDSTGISHTITTSQKFATDMTDLGTTAKYSMNAGSSVLCTDKYTFKPDGDTTYSFWCTADATATDEAGCIQVLEEGNKKVILDVTSLEIDDADAPTTCTVTLQHRANPALVMTWTSLTVA
jgi:hypothetical protein